MRSKFAKIIDSVAILVASFVLIFAWVRFYTHNPTLSLIIGGILGIFICFFINFFTDKRAKKKIGTAQSQKSAEKLGLNLLGATNDEILDYFFAIFCQNNFSVKKLPNCLKVSQNLTPNHPATTTKNELIFPFFHKLELTQDDLILILKIARSLEENNIKIYSISASADAKNFAKKIHNFTINFCDQYDLFSISNSVTAPVTFDLNSAKLTYKDYWNFAFQKSRAKNYLCFGLILLATSFFVPFKLYYLIGGSLLCLLALAVRLANLKRT